MLLLIKHFFKPILIRIGLNLDRILSLSYLFCMYLPIYIYHIYIYIYIYIIYIYIYIYINIYICFFSFYLSLTLKISIYLSSSQNFEPIMFNTEIISFVFFKKVFKQFYRYMFISRFKVYLCVNYLQLCT